MKISGSNGWTGLVRRILSGLGWVAGGDPWRGRVPPSRRQFPPSSRGAARSLTSVFGMGLSVSSLLSPPRTSKFSFESTLTSLKTTEFRPTKKLPPRDFPLWSSSRLISTGPLHGLGHLPSTPSLSTS